MTSKSRGVIKAGQIHEDMLWGIVEGHAFVNVDDVIGNVWSITVVDIGSGTAGVYR